MNITLEKQCLSKKKSGWDRDLANLNQGRDRHACARYLIGDTAVITTYIMKEYFDKSRYPSNPSFPLNIYIYQILIVTGGKIGGTHFDSTEIYSNNGWMTVTAKLPTGMIDMRATTINNRVLVTGKFGKNCLKRLINKFILRR